MSWKSIHKSFPDFTFCMEPYLNDPENEILYFGDLDYEGIIILKIFIEILGQISDLLYCL